MATLATTQIQQPQQEYELGELIGLSLSEWRWLKESDSEESQRNRLSIWRSFCRSLNMTSEEVVTMARQAPIDESITRIEDALSRFLDERVKSGVAMSTAAFQGGAVKGCFKANRVALGKLPKKYRGTGSTFESKSHRVLTQDEVHVLIQKEVTIQGKLAILLLAQSGQRLGIITALRYDMVRPDIATLVDEMGKDKSWTAPWAFIDVSPQIVNKFNRAVNKARVGYTFGLHPQSMAAIIQFYVKQQAKPSDYILSISHSTIQRVVNDAAVKAGIQHTDETGLKERKCVIHPHRFRAFFLDRMGQSGLESERIFEFLLGHKVKYGGTYHAGWFKDEKLLEIYHKAEPLLSVL